MIGLDSTFIIDFLDGKKDAVSVAETHAQDILVTTPITLFEVLVGYHAKGNAQMIRQAVEFFDQLDIIPITTVPATRGAEQAGALIREGRTVGAMDTLIASALQFYGCNSIITRDGDFSRIKDLRIITY
ncbi:PIN domain-containing protein [Candidatus Woesearchaeota archaeon]|nr:PIN domain-containing protein [Candidatus Woesearchaeota archaeon]